MQTVYVPNNLIWIFGWTARQRTDLRSPHPRCTFLTTWAAETNLTWYYAIPWWLIVFPIYYNCVVPHVTQTTSGPFSHGYEHQTGLNTYHTRFLIRRKKANKPEFCVWWRFNLALHGKKKMEIASFCKVTILLSESFHPFGAYVSFDGWSTTPPRNSRPYDQGLWQPLGSLNKAHYQTLIFLGRGYVWGGIGWLAIILSLSFETFPNQRERGEAFCKIPAPQQHALQCSSHSLSCLRIFRWVGKIHVAHPFVFGLKTRKPWLKTPNSSFITLL